MVNVANGLLSFLRGEAGRIIDGPATLYNCEEEEEEMEKEEKKKKRAGQE